MTKKMYSTEQGWVLLDEAKKYLPRGGTVTNSKVPLEILRNVEPAYFVRGQGSRLWDYDGNEYVDFRLAMGPVTLGYNYPEVTQAVKNILDEGTIFSGPNLDELRLAKKIVEIIPCAQMVSYLKTGGEAVAATWTAARAFTDKDKILKSGYNGWLQETNTPGIPAVSSSLVEVFKYGDIAWLAGKLEKEADQIAAVCIAMDYEKVSSNEDFLYRVRELTNRHGVLMIVDEIVTGFRVALAGVQEYFGFVPDIAIFAKGIANGFPISVYCGRRDVMSVLSEKAFVTSTYAGDRIGITAALATIDVYQKKNVIKHLWHLGERVKDGFQKILRDHKIEAVVGSLPPCSGIFFKYADQNFNKRFQMEIDRGLYQRGISWRVQQLAYISFSHTNDDIETLLAAFEEAVVHAKKVVAG